MAKNSSLRKVILLPKRFYIFLAFLLILIFSIGFSIWKQPTTSFEFTTYTNTNYGFQLENPGSYTITCAACKTEADIAMTHNLELIPPKNSNREIINILITKPEDPQRLEGMIEPLKKIQEGINVTTRANLSTKVVTIDGKDALQLVSTHKVDTEKADKKISGGTKKMTIKTVVFEYGLMYQLSLSKEYGESAPEIADFISEEAADYKKVISTFKFTLN